MLLAGTAADRVSAGLVLGGMVCTLVALFGRGAPRVRTVHNPKPKHLGAKIKRWEKRTAALRRRQEAINQALNRLDRTHRRTSQKRLLEAALEKTMEALQRERIKRRMAVAEAEDKYDAERRGRPVKKNPKKPAPKFTPAEARRVRAARANRPPRPAWVTPEDWEEMGAEADLWDALPVPKRPEWVSPKVWAESSPAVRKHLAWSRAAK